jgi:hypothetical protein
MIPTPILDRLADVDLKTLHHQETSRLHDELYAMTGIGLSFKNFDDFELVIYRPGDCDVRVRWPIPALRTVREARALAEQLMAASIAPA